MTFEYLIQENIGGGQLSTIASKSGFPTEDDAKAEGEQEAARIAKSFSTTLTVNVRRVE